MSWQHSALLALVSLQSIRAQGLGAILGATAASNQLCRLDVCFVVDHSGSIRDANVNGVDNWQYILQFMYNLVGQLNVSPSGTHVALVGFGNNAELVFNLTAYTDLASLQNAILTYGFLGGNTNTTGGLRVMRTQVFTTAAGDRPGVPDVAILITDGIPTREVDILPAEDGADKATGIAIIGIGVTNQVNNTLMEQLVSNPATDYFNVSDYSLINQALQLTVSQACVTVVPTTSLASTSAMTTTSAATTTSPRTTITSARTATTTSPRTTTSPKTTTSPRTTTKSQGGIAPIQQSTTPLQSGEATGVIANCRLDVCFVVDHSGSIRDADIGNVDNWSFIIQFMVTIVSSLNVSPTGTHVAVVGFGNLAELDFNLTAFTNLASLQNAIENNVPYLGGNTNTTGGLRVMRTQVFTTAAGDRPDVPDVAILITDGIPTREVDILPAEDAADKAAGIKIIGIGVTNQVNNTLMQQLVSDPNTDYFNVSDYSQINAALQQTLVSSCSTPAPSPPTTSQPTTVSATTTTPAPSTSPTTTTPAKSTSPATTTPAKVTVSPTTTTPAKVTNSPTTTTPAKTTTSPTTTTTTTTTTTKKKKVPTATLR